MKDYNHRRTPEYIKAMNSKRKRTKEQNNEHSRTHYNRYKRVIKQIEKNPAGIAEILPDDDLIGVRRKR